MSKKIFFKKNQSNFLISFIIFLLIISSFWLFSVSNRALNLNKNTNWWSIYFTHPQTNGLSFIIENHSNDTQFYWKILANQKKIQEGSLEIKKGSKAKPKIKDLVTIPQGEKITIQVINGNNKNNQEEIYKNN